MCHIAEQAPGRAGTSHPSREVRGTCIFGEMPEGPSRQITWLYYANTGPGGSPDRMDSLKALGPVRTKTPVFLLVGQIPGWGSSLKWTGGRPLVWVSGQNSRGSVLSTALFI